MKNDLQLLYYILIKAEGESLKKEMIRGYILNISGCISLFLAACCAGLIYIVKIEGIKFWYTGIQAKLFKFEEAVAAIEDWWLFIIVIALLYFIKSLIPLISTSAICVITGMVLPVYISLPVNIAGTIMSFSIKYCIGRKFGGENDHNIFFKNNQVKSLLENNGKGNPWLLIAFRIIPNFPLNSVSRYYGQMKFKYINFILLSLFGYAPKLISYTTIGRNLYDPLSASFLTPIIVILSISGFSLLFINTIWNFVGKKHHAAHDKINIE